MVRRAITSVGRNVCFYFSEVCDGPGLKKSLSSTYRPLASDYLKAMVKHAVRSICVPHFVIYEENREEHVVALASS